MGTLDSLSEGVKSFNPDIVGLSTTEATYDSGLKLLDSIKDSDIFTSFS